MKVYITKYALTEGIFESDVEKGSDSTVSDRKRGYTSYYHGQGREWHLTRQSAVDRANQMRLRKLKTLQNQIAKLSIPFE